MIEDSLSSKLGYMWDKYFLRIAIDFDTLALLVGVIISTKKGFIMQKYILLSIIMLWTSSVLAQESCDSVVEALPVLAEACAEAESLCRMTVDAEGTSTIEMLALNDYMAQADFEAIATIHTDEIESFTLLRLPLNEAPLMIVAFGNTRLENRVALTEIEVLALRGVNLRATPSIAATVIGSLLQGETYTAVGRLEDNTWVRVRLETGQIGWVSAQFLQSNLGFMELTAVSPNSPAYLAMQAFDLYTEDACSAVLLIAPKSAGIYELAINGLIVQVHGAALVNLAENEISVASLAGETSVKAFGFEQIAAANEIIRIPVNALGMLRGIPSEAENYVGLVLPYALFLD